MLARDCGRIPIMANETLLRPYPAFERHRQELAIAARQRRLRLVGGGAALLTVGIGCWLVHPMLAFMVAGVGAMALFFSSLSGGSTVPPAELLGIEGELRALKFLRQLPDEYRILNRIRIADPTLPNGERELDFVVAGPTGLFLVEVKNTPGLIQVQPESTRWAVVKRAGCGSSPRWNSLPNPLVQVRAQIESLQRLLLSHGLDLAVKPIICFARPEVGLQNTEACPVPVLVPEQLPERIESGQTSSEESVRRLERVVELLSRTVSSSGPAKAA